MSGTIKSLLIHTRTFLSVKNQSAVLLASLLIGFGTPVFAAGKSYQWRLAYTWPDDFPLFTVSIKNMVNYAKTLSGGRLNITIEGGTTHKKPFGIFDMVKSNDYQMGQSAGFYWIDKDVNTALLCTIPFGMVAQERYAWFYHGGGNELTQKVYSTHGLMSFPSGNIGMQMGGWFKKEINTVEDLKGLKMRIPGLGGTVMKALGVDAINLPASELADALKSGELDAVDWANPAIDLGMNLYQDAKYYYTGWQEPAVELQFLVNQEAYQSLPEDLQGILNISMKLAAFEAFTNYHHHNIIKLQELRSKHKDIKIRSFPTSVTRALSRETDKQLQVLANSGNELTREIVESLRNYQEKARLWSRIGDQAYLNNAGL
ncbi:MAG: TRAP transporter substrate-binding protein [Arenicella sp.]